MCFHILECHSGGRFKSKMHSTGPDWNRKNIYVRKHSDIVVATWYTYLYH